jgi:hypothetical protein
MLLRDVLPDLLEDLICFGSQLRIAGMLGYFQEANDFKQSLMELGIAGAAQSSGAGERGCTGGRTADGRTADGTVELQAT